MRMNLAVLSDKRRRPEKPAATVESRAVTARPWCPPAMPAGQAAWPDRRKPILAHDHAA